jgi:hypothetical protein
MQMLTRCTHRSTHGGPPRSGLSLAYDSVLGKRRVRSCVPAPPPRTDARRHYHTAVSSSRKLISDSGVLPQQIQQVLRRSAGAGMTVLERAGGGMRCLTPPEPVADHQGFGLSLVPIAPTFDPFRLYKGAQPVAFRLSLQGRQEVHWRTLPLCYTICSDQPWTMLLGGAELAAMEQQSISCVKVAFPAHALVEIRLVPGMLHGFEGRLDGVCTAFHRPGSWRWKSTAPLAQAWPVSTWVGPDRVHVLVGRSIPWELLQHWQCSVPVERSPNAIAWEAAQWMLLPR